MSARLQRRAVLRCLFAALGGVAVSPRMVSRIQAAESCGDDSNEGLRSSLNYIRVAKDREQRCETCAFFSVASSTACGNCAIMSGPVVAAGHCDSWTAKKP